MAKVLVGMSGGTDSSIAAALIKKQGHDVIGISMEIWDGDSEIGDTTRHGCYSPGEKEDIESAREVAEILGIPFYTVDLKKEYKSTVLDYFCNEYLAGRTPNPCIRCNHRIKFQALLEKAKDNGIECDFFATGHYARIEFDENRKHYLLKKARDIKKDQSYFLSSLTQEQLKRTLFPVGEYTKPEVRKMAADFGLGVENRAESQDFIEGGYLPLIEAGAQPGQIMDQSGNILGQHRGIPFYTIGQRKGLGITAEKPLYVIKIDAENNAVIVGGKEAVYSDELIASSLNWIAVSELQESIKVKARIRYNHKETGATVSPQSEDRVHVKFDKPQMAVTPGQAVVFYDGDVVVGGGTIEKAEG